MQIVIELSDDTYKDIKEENGIYGINNGLSARITGKVVGAIQTGTPLPKGHGRIVDIGPYEGKVIASRKYCGVNKLVEVAELDTILEADKAESEEKI